MSDFSGHLRGGWYAATVVLVIFLLLQIVYSAFAWLELPLFIGLALFGALWPDTDLGSISQRIVYALFIGIDLFLIFGLGYYKEAAVFGLFAMMPAVSKHRGWTHSPFWLHVVGLPLLLPSFIGGNDFLIDLEVYKLRNLIFFGIPYYVSFILGGYSHLILDFHPYFKKQRSKKKS